MGAVVRPVVLVLLVVVLVLVPVAPVAAEVEPNPLECDARLVVRPDEGRTQVVEAGDVSVRMPRVAEVSWTGSVGTPVHNGSGELRLRVGFWSVAVARWRTNVVGDDSVREQGTRSLPAFLQVIPPGGYRVEGRHGGDEGACSGAATVVIAGSSLTNVVAVGGAVLAFLLVPGFVAAGRLQAGRRRGKPLMGALAGLLLGVTVSGLLVTTYLVTSDSRLVTGLPLGLLLVGLVLGLVAPFRRPAA